MENTKEQKLLGVVHVELYDTGNMHVSFPKNKEMTIGILLDALKQAAFMPDESKKPPLILVSSINVAGKITQRVS